MILLSTAVKVISILTMLLAAGGSSYYLLKSTNDSEVAPTQNLKHEHHKHETHHFHGEEVFDGEFHHVCDHGNYIKTLEINVQEVEEGIEAPIEATFDHEMKLRSEHKAGNWQPIRIMADYSGFTASASQKRFIEQKLMRAATGFLSAAYSVYPLNSLKVNRCGNVQVPAKYKSGITGYDLVLFVSASNSNENWLARAGPCQLDGTNYRPTAGTVEFNLKYLNKLNVDSLTDKSWYGWIQTTVHEVTHVLGFSSSLFPYYVNPSTNQRLGINSVQSTGNGRNWVILPKVVDHVKRHFGCQSATGAPLENDGGQGTAGSHWERTTFGNEAMTGSEFPDSVFTEFTFSLMESTGWYLPDYKQSEPYNWGKSEGCPIAQGQCSGKMEFCRSNGTDGCSPDSMGIAACSTQDQLAPGCGYWKSYGNTDCRNPSDQINTITKNTGGFVGTGSRCFLTTLPKSVGYGSLPADCFQSSCSNNVITFKVGTQSYQCTSSGQVVQVKWGSYKGAVTCPDIQFFCNTTKSCPNNCSGVGTCRGTTCNCWKGYTGTDCSQMVGSY